MGLDIYNMVVDILGELPLELHFLYALGTIFVLILVLFCAMLPFIVVYKVWGD